MHPFRTAVEARDPDAMAACMAQDVRFYSPVAFKPFAGREAVNELFWNLFEVFEDFKELEGLDHLVLGEDGLVSEFTVMIRPLSALMAMGEAMAPRVGHLEKDDATKMAAS